MVDKKETYKPRGELVMKTVAMPSDTNANGDIFGGWVLSQMDLGGGVIAKGLSPSGRAVTVSIEGMSFVNSIQVGDVVSCYATILERGHTSVRIEIETWVYNYMMREEKRVTHGIFKYVAVNEGGRSIAIIK